MRDAGVGAPAVVIRPATPDDAPTIARHRAAMFCDMGQLDAAAVPVLAAAARRWVEAAMVDGRYVAWLAEVEAAPAADGPRHVVGGGGVEVRAIAPRPAADGRGVQTAPQALVRDVYVVPAWRGRGVARRVMEALLAWTTERGVSNVVLHASAAGRPLYERLGFVPTNEMRYAPASAAAPNDSPGFMPNNSPT